MDNAGQLNRYNQGAVMPERAPSAVQTAQQALDENTSRLHGIIGELEQRLQPVLGPSKPQGVGEKSNLPPSTVSARVSESARVVNGAVSRIEEIIARLEV